MNDTDNQPMEVVAPSALMSIERAQIDSQVATAKQYPRELAKFKVRAESMATLDGETSESCVYCRPVGKDKNGKMKFAEGPSIRMAEIVATCYGNIRVAARVVEQTPRYVKCEGMAHDLEVNFAAKAEVVESTVGSNGQPYSERQAALMAKVCISKAMRDATFRVVPRALMKPILDKCKAVIAKQTATVEERMKRIQAWVATLRIDEKRVFAVIGVKGWNTNEFTTDMFDTLTGLKTAIQDGDAIDDIFPPITAANAPEQTAHTQSQAANNAATVPKQDTKAAEPAANPPADAKPAGKAGKSGGAKTAATKETAGAAPAAIEPKAPEKESKPAAKPENAAEPAQAEPQGEPEPDPELAEMGLAPEPEPEKAAEPAAAPAPAGAFTPRPGETAELTKVRELMFSAGQSEESVMKWALANKFAREGQKLSDMSTQKLLAITNNWPKILAKIKAVAG